MCVRCSSSNVINCVDDDAAMDISTNRPSQALVVAINFINFFPEAAGRAHWRGWENWKTLMREKQVGGKTLPPRRTWIRWGKLDTLWDIEDDKTTNIRQMSQRIVERWRFSAEPGMAGDDRGAEKVLKINTLTQTPGPAKTWTGWLVDGRCFWTERRTCFQEGQGWIRDC